MAYPWVKPTRSNPMVQSSKRDLWSGWTSSCKFPRQTRNSAHVIHEGAHQGMARAVAQSPSGEVPLCPAVWVRMRLPPSPCLCVCVITHTSLSIGESSSCRDSLETNGALVQFPSIFHGGSCRATSRFTVAPLRPTQASKARALTPTAGF